MGNRHHKYVFAKDQPVRLQGDKIVYEDFKKSYEQMEFDSRFIGNFPKYFRKSLTLKSHPRSKNHVIFPLRKENLRRLSGNDILFEKLRPSNVAQ